MLTKEAARQCPHCDRQEQSSAIRTAHRDLPRNGDCLPISQIGTWLNTSSLPRAHRMVLLLSYGTSTHRATLCVKHDVKALCLSTEHGKDAGPDVRGEAEANGWSPGSQAVAFTTVTVHEAKGDQSIQMPAQGWLTGYPGGCELIGRSLTGLGEGIDNLQADRICNRLEPSGMAPEIGIDIAHSTVRTKVGRDRSGSVSTEPADRGPLREIGLVRKSVSRSLRTFASFPHQPDRYKQPSLQMSRVVHREREKNKVSVTQLYPNGTPGSKSYRRAIRGGF